MVSILIKGMDMPISCWDCFLRKDCDEIIIWSKRRPSKCPLVEVPTPHGRLVDADALADYCHRQAKNKWNESTHTSWAYAYASFESDVEDAPTIIESEG